MSESVRLDKWLWAARFYKTRSVAAQAIGTGKVQVDGVRPKPARQIRVGDMVQIRQGPYEIEIEVVELSERRGPAKVAVTLYRETDESIDRRESLAATLKAQRAAQSEFKGRGRPTKKDRRDLMKVVGRGISGGGRKKR